ncbi:hypothetical protein Btru_050463 [Bulinus truncatus]|nr:hypothetical protein Btru_050463 [Bulinus truncatus]
MNSTESNTFITNETYILVMSVLNIPLLCISFIGICTNTLNVIVFARQGILSHSVTTSFFALAVSDLLACLFVVPQTLCHYVENYVANLDVFSKSCTVLAFFPATFPHLIFSNTTCWITLYISLERAVCVLLPLKAKLLVSTKKTMSVLTMIVCSTLAINVPYVFYCDGVWLTDPVNNASAIFVNVETPTAQLLHMIIVLAEAHLLSSVSMVAVSIATVVMIVQLRVSSTWRVKTFHAGRDAQSSNLKKAMAKKDKEVVKLVISVTLVYLASYASSNITALAIKLKLVDNLMTPIESKLKLVDNLLAPIDSKLKLVDNLQAPIDSKLKLVDNLMAPVDSKLKLVDNLLAPVDSKLKLVDNLMAPIDSKLKLVNNLQAPIDSKLKLVGNLMAPIDSKLKLVDNLQAPIDSKLKLVDNLQAPIDSKLKLVNNLQAPIDSKLKLVGNLMAPIDSKLKLVDNLQAPIDSKLKLVDNLQAPIDSKLKLVDNLMAPIINDFLKRSFNANKDN